MVKRKSKITTAGQPDIKQGDLIWVKYKGIDWPAKVSAVYPKKITYYYLPLDAAVMGQPFKTNNPKSVKLIQIDDSIPACKDPKLGAELRVAFDQAKKFLRNPNAPVDVNDTIGSSTLNGSLQQGENGSQSSNQGSPSAKDKWKKKAAKELRSEHDLDEPEDEEEIGADNPDFINFQIGDVVIVASDIGTWPGKILELYEDHTICKLFPLNEKNEPCRVVYDNIQEFPVEDLDDYMEETRDNENLYIAFEGVKQYLENRAGGSTQAKTETKPKAKDTANDAGQKEGRKRRAGSEKELEGESDRESHSRHESRAKRRHNNAVNDKATKKVHTENAMADAVPTDPVSKKASKPKSFLDTIISDQAEQHMKAIWESKVDILAYNDYSIPTQLHQLCFNFNNGGLLTFSDVEKAIPKIKNMVKICTKLPKMSELVEFHYIVNVVIPELCVFGLSQVDGTSLDKAREKYEGLVSKETETSDKKDERAAASNGSFKISNSLLMAASRAKNEEEEEQKIDT